MITKCAGDALGDEDLAPPTTSSGQPFWRRTKPAKPIATRSSGSPSARLAVAPFGGRRAARRELWTIVERQARSGSAPRRRGRSRSPRRPSAPSASAIARLRRSRPSPASAERRCQTTFAPLRCATQRGRRAAASRSGARAGSGASRISRVELAQVRRQRGDLAAEDEPAQPLVRASPRRARRSRRRRCGRSRRRRRRAPPPGPPGRRRAARSAGRGARISCASDDGAPPSCGRWWT